MRAPVQRTEVSCASLPVGAVVDGYPRALLREPARDLAPYPTRRPVTNATFPGDPPFLLSNQSRSPHDRRRVSLAFPPAGRTRGRPARSSGPPPGPRERIKGLQGRATHPAATGAVAGSNRLAAGPGDTFRQTTPRCGRFRELRGIIDRLRDRAKRSETCLAPGNKLRGRRAGVDAPDPP